MEEKSELIQVWLALAEEKLEVAHELLDLSRFDDAVSKAYYVMFYSAKAALLAVDVDLRRHSGVVSQFGQHFVKGGYADRRYSRILAKRRAGKARYDFVQRDAEGQLHVYYGVTEEGIHGPWREFLEGE